MFADACEKKKIRKHIQPTSAKQEKDNYEFVITPRLG